MKTDTLATARPPERLLRSNLAQQVYEILEQRIIQGEMPPGTHLAEEAIATEFGVSRSPVREAIIQLERIGLAERAGMRDRRVAVPSVKFVAETFDTWAILEVARCYSSSLAAPPEDHQKILRVLDLMEQEHSKPTGPLSRYGELSLQFHELLKCRCQNSQLMAVLQVFEKHRRWLAALYGRRGKRSGKSMNEHRQIADAYIKKDLIGLTVSIQRHTNRHRDLALEALSSERVANSQLT